MQKAAALNWRSLSKADQAKVIHAYFAAPEDGGLGYTVGRVPINSCDFGPGGPERGDLRAPASVASGRSAVR